MIRKIKNVRKNAQNSALAMESAVLSTIQKKSQQQSKNIFRSQSKLIKTFFFQEFCLFFSKWSPVQVKCRSESRSNSSQRKCDIFFCLATKSDETAITFSNGKPIFHQMVICTRKKHFWRLRRKFCITKLKRFIQISKMMKKLRIDRKNIIKFVLWRRKTQFCQQCKKKFVKSPKFFHSRSQNH